MDDLRKTFNKSSELGPEDAYRQALAGLDLAQQQLVEDFKQRLDKKLDEVRDRHDSERISRITGYANNLVHQPRLEPGSQRMPDIKQHEVTALMQEAEKTGRPITELATSPRQQFIAMGYQQAKDFEKREIEARTGVHEADVSKMIENLRTLTPEELERHGFPGRDAPHSNEKPENERSLSDEFNRRR